MKWVLHRMPKPVAMDGTDKVYIFSPQRNIFLAWVEESDVQKLLNHKMKTCNCNNGTYNHAFALASRLDVGIWEVGDRHYLNPNYQETT